MGVSEVEQWQEGSLGREKEPISWTADTAWTEQLSSRRFHGRSGGRAGSQRPCVNMLRSLDLALQAAMEVTL